jgi:hypothetical protein
MSRHFSDFLTAYGEYAYDGFVPNRFHDWAALSIIAAALERKVTLKRSLIHYVPNIFVMLVSHPGGGKSVAIERATDLIEDMKASEDQNFRIIPNQATEPALIDMMKIVEHFQVTPSQFLPHSSGYFYASEASASALQNTCGDFVAAMTAFYDCPRWFRKKLKGEQHAVEIENSCMNMIAGATFDYLKTLVNESSVMGGFASRNIYVVSPERKVSEAGWDNGISLNTELKRKLVEDLAHIHKIVGPMTASKDWITKFEKWEKEFQQYLIDLKSPRLESIMARKGTNFIKLNILMSISEGDSRRLEAHHFDRALEFIDRAYSDNPQIIAQAAMSDKASQSGMNQTIGQILKKHRGEMPMKLLRQLSLANGNQVDMITKTIDFMLASGWIALDSESNVKLLVDPDRHL